MVSPKAYGAAMVGSSYKEPSITAEWAVDVFKMLVPLVQNCVDLQGNATPQVLGLRATLARPIVTRSI